MKKYKFWIAAALVLAVGLALFFLIKAYSGDTFEKSKAALLKLSANYSTEEAVRDGVVGLDIVYDAQPPQIEAFCKAVEARKPASLKLFSCKEGGLMIWVVDYTPDKAAIRSFGRDLIKQREEADVWFAPQPEKLVENGITQLILSSIPNPSLPLDPKKHVQPYRFTICQYRAQ